MSDFESRLTALLKCCGGDFQEAADKICEQYSDFSVLAQTERSVLISVCGEKYVDMIKILAAVNSRRISDSFKFGVKHSEEEIAEFLSGYFFDRTIETVVVMPLDAKGNILGAHSVFEGTVSLSEIIPRKILEAMIGYNSKKLILAHNHPRGSSNASEEDMYATQRLYDILSSVGKELVCHYVVAPNEIKKLVPRRYEDMVE